MEADTGTIQRAQEGDAAAFEAVLEASYGSMYRFAMKYTTQRADAEDITQQACIKLAESIHLFRFESKFSSWVYRLVVNCAHDWSRKNSRPGTQQVSFEHMQAGFAGGEHSLALSRANPAEPVTELQQVLGIVAGYGQEFLDTLVLVHGEGINHREAAEILQVKESTVSWRIHEIRKRLAADQAGGES